MKNEKKKVKVKVKGEHDTLCWELDRDGRKLGEFALSTPFVTLTFKKNY